MEDSQMSSSSPDSQLPSSAPNPASASATSLPTVQPPGASESAQAVPLTPNTVPQASSTTQKGKRSRKRGNPGKFQGEHLQFLQTRIKGYLSLSTRQEKSLWIAQLTHEWFEKHPWHTQSEPAEFAVLHDDSGVTLSVEERAELEKRRDDLLTRTVQDGQKELLNWVHRQVQRSAHKEKGKAFVAISNQMSKGTRGAPRRKPNYKHFMSHPDHKSDFQAYYEEKTEANPPSKSQRMAVQCRLAKELYESQTEDVKTKIALENAETYSERFAAFKKLLSGQ
ncbi:hypothetical protein EV361DRAFT_957282, partial [Lentinula raphanica]